MDLESLWHTTSHILAQAVLRLYKDTRLGIGPPTKEGFYYDFEFSFELKEEDLQKIQEVMQEIINEDLKLQRIEVSKQEAYQIFKKANQLYKLELLEEIEDSKVSLYKQGEFIDLCKGPHLSTTKDVGAFKLLKIAGAYWKGDENNKMLTRIYGISFETKKELEEYLKKQQELKRYSHQRLGKDMELFFLHEDIGAGLVTYLPKGTILRWILEDFSKEEHLKRGYLPVISPHIAKLSLWQTSGHKEIGYPMFELSIEEREYCIKPMNCPFHIYIYKQKQRSYRELPLKFFELGTVYRYEKSGVLAGLLRVRGFTQDDAHIFCTPKQLNSQLKEILDFVFYMLKRCGFEEYLVFLSTQPERFIGSQESWELATAAAKAALDDLKINFEIDPQEGVFYGPKIDIKLKDIFGRLWQGPTIQIDFNLPKRFNLTYIDEDGKQKPTVMIHRAIFGSFERFIASLLEHHKGQLPIWLAPTQVVILPLSDKFKDYAQRLYEFLKNQGARVEIDMRAETLGYKIRECQLKKIPFILIVGKKEQEKGGVSVRFCSEDLGFFELDVFIKKLKDEIKQAEVRNNNK